jgi:energy-coupling factor transporter ATP-binding protein EcfA2
MLTIRDVFKSFRGVNAMRDVSPEVTEGKIVGLIGPDGSGKSTLFNVIDGLHKPTRGSVHRSERRIDGLSPDHVARLAGSGALCRAGRRNGRAPRGLRKHREQLEVRGPLLRDPRAESRDCARRGAASAGIRP